ncbi:drug/metabolite transporter (DMT)-like permease [Micromonospora pisi]|uniref:Drug/metabolite transporter (DMT)-like permease n=1 Tax=Micromonospora pisi TaxID=589240 RepID=A0A495JMB2_9ACTN|nr:DMT family transporter [Micromonospora pisi]RKR89474.1 drug/metabolite transporter (DMT)-like permease [Micromonospora pisi]
MTAPTAPDSNVRAWLPGFLTVAVIWGASFLFIKIGVRELHPLYVTLGRVVAGALTLLVALAVLRDRLPRDPKLWLHMVVIAAVGVALPFTFFGYGEQRVSSILAGIWNATTPLVVLPMAVLVFRTERMTARRAIGMTLGFLGVLVVLGAWRGLGGAEFTGQLFCFAAAACYGLSIPYQKRFVAGRPESGVALSAAQLLVAAGQLAIVAPLVAGAPPAPTSLSFDVIASVLALGALGTGLAFVINLRTIRLAGASTASTVTYLIPIFAVLIGVLALDEQLAWYQPVGAVIVLAGVAVSQRLLGRRRPRRGPDPGPDPAVAPQQSVEPAVPR